MQKALRRNGTRSLRPHGNGTDFHGFLKVAFYFSSAKICAVSVWPKAPRSIQNNMLRSIYIFIISFCLLAPLRADAPFTLTNEQIMAALSAEKPLEDGMWLETLDLNNMSVGYGQAQARKSVDGNALRLGGVTYPHGIGTHANSVMNVDLKGAVDRFLCAVGLDDEGKDNAAKVVFKVVADGKTLFDSGTKINGEKPDLINVDVRGVKRLTLSATAPNNQNIWTHADWAGAMFLLDDDSTARPESVSLAPATSLRAFPPPFIPAEAPAVYGPQIFGCTPKKPFFQRIWATGKAPFKFTADRLPKGLQLDSEGGLITGKIEEAGNYDFAIGVSNAKGKIVVPMSIICGQHKLAQTPPMGWNAWNVFGETVSVDKVKEQADLLIESGLAQMGYNYVIIDDTWQARRADDGTIFSNKRFGDITELADYLHGRGLKLGLYSTPNLETCSGYAGSYGHEEQDAMAYAEWGVDYLKYDWCQVGSNKENTTPEVMQEAYGRMRKALDKAPRDIVWALTPYGFGEAYKWAGDLGANSWFTDVGIQDTFASIKSNSDRLDNLAKYAGPGHWNDAGWLMMGKFSPNKPRFSNLLAPELQLQMTQWTIANTPLILSCDLRQLDPNKLYPVNTSLLTNPEVLAVNQDILGATAKRNGWETETWVKPLIDGTMAVALLNKSDSPREVAVSWWNLGKSGKQMVRDLWKREDLGEFDNEFKTFVPRHGAMLVKIGQPLAPSNEWRGLNRNVFLRPVGRWGEGLRWAWSRNGIDWAVDNKTRFKPEVGGKQMRDNTLERGPDGTYFMLWTTGDKDSGFGYASSKDLLHWSEQNMVPVDKGVLAGRLREAKHPQLFWDKKGAQWIIVFAAEVTDNKPNGWRIYAVATKDFKTVSEPKLLLDTTYRATYPNLIESKGRYYLFYRDDDKRTAKISAAASPLGPFDVSPDLESLLPAPEPVDPKKKKPAPPHDPGAPLSWGMDIENIKLMSWGDDWLVTFFRSGKDQSHIMLKSRDLKAWSEAKPNMMLAKDFRAGDRVTTTETTLMEILRGN